MDILSHSTPDRIKICISPGLCKKPEAISEPDKAENSFSSAFTAYKNPGNNPGSDSIHAFYGTNFFSHPDFTVGTGIPSVYESHQFCRRSGSRTIPPVGNCTRPRRIHSFYKKYYNSLQPQFQGLFSALTMFPSFHSISISWFPRILSPRTYPFFHLDGIAGKYWISSVWLCTSISAMPAVNPQAPSI